MICLGRNVMGENGIPPAGTFSTSRPTGLAWPGLPLWQPLQQGTRLAALSDAYQISPVKISRNFWGIDFL